MNRTQSDGVVRFLSITAVVVLLGFGLIPYLFLFIGSLLPNSIVDNGIWVGVFHGWTLSNHLGFIDGEYQKYVGYFVNTLIVSGTSSILVVLVSLIGGFGLTRSGLSAHWVSGFEGTLLAAYLIPPIALVFPYAVIFAGLGINGSLLGLIIANVAFCFPFGLWLLVRFMHSVPREFDQAAAADGAGWFDTLIFVMIPRVFPGLVAVGVLTYILSWNDVALSLVLGTTATRTLAAGVKESILDVEQSRYGSFAAASIWVAMPLAIFFSLLYGWIDSRLRAEAEEAN